MNCELASLGYIKDGDKYLMLHRNKKPNDKSEGKYVAIGGKIEHDESPDEAIVREVKEETGLDVIEYKIKGIVTYPNFYDGITDYMNIYEITKVEGEITNCNEGTLEWLPKEELSKKNMWEGDRLILEWLDHTFFTAKIKYVGDKMEEHSVRFVD